MKHVTIKLWAKQYENSNDCLAAATADYVSDHPEAEGYDMAPRWEGGEDGDREVILLDVPSVGFGPCHLCLSETENRHGNILLGNCECGDHTIEVCEECYALEHTDPIPCSKAKCA